MDTDRRPASSVPAPAFPKLGGEFGSRAARRKAARKLAEDWVRQHQPQAGRAERRATIEAIVAELA